MASSENFTLDIVTPQKEFFSGEVNSLIAPGLDGLFQVLKGHAPLLAALKSGKLRLSLPDRSENTFQISDGFFEVSNNKAILLTENIS